MTSYQFKILLILAMVSIVGCRTADRFPNFPNTKLFKPGQSTFADTNASQRIDYISTDGGDVESRRKRPTVALASYQDRAGTQFPVRTASTPLTNKKYGLLDVRSQTPIPSSRSLSLSLGQAIELSFDQNLDLAAIRATEPVARAAMEVANTYPYNPQVQTQVLPYSRDTNGADGAVSQQHVIVQTFERGGQQQHREGIARESWRQVDRTIRQAELMNAAQTTRLYLAALYQRELRDLNQSLAEMNEQLIGVIERREKAGQSNKADVELARLQAKASLRQLRLAESSYQTSLTTLRTQLNFDPNSPLELGGHWLNWQWHSMDLHPGSGQNPRLANGGYVDSPTSYDPLDNATLRQLVINRPDVAAAQAAVAVARENLRLADAMRRPSIQGGPMYQRDNSSTSFWGLQAQFDIPVVNNGKPLVRQRSAELRLQQATADQLENRAVLEAGAAMQRYERARRLVEQTRPDFDHGISGSLKPFEAQFRAGQITLLQVFAARTTIAQSQQSFFDLLNELALATADVTQATGIMPQQFIGQLDSEN